MIQVQCPDEVKIDTVKVKIDWNKHLTNPHVGKSLSGLLCLLAAL